MNYAQYFIHDSYLAPIQPVNLGEGEKTVLPFANVTFEPGCRNNWHVHHGMHHPGAASRYSGLYTART